MLVDIAIADRRRDVDIHWRSAVGKIKIARRAAQIEVAGDHRGSAAPGVLSQENVAPQGERSDACLNMGGGCRIGVQIEGTDGIRKTV